MNGDIEKRTCGIDRDDDRFRSRKIFVLGTGRSGTHWVGHILESHKDISISIEKEPMFNWATQMALDPRLYSELFPRLIQEYRKEHDAVRPKYYADKSHPNLWIAEGLAEALSDALFVGVERNVFATVASMLKHRGILGWFDKWRLYPVPNSFLGITNEIKDVYDDLSVEAKCALRWLSHSQQLNKLRTALGAKLHIIVYERLQKNTEVEIASLTSFLQLNSPISVPMKIESSLNRWRDELSETAQNEIRAIVQDYCGDV